MATNTEQSKRTGLPTIPTPSLPTHEMLEITYELTDTELKKQGLIFTQSISYENIQSYETMHIHGEYYDLRIQTETKRYTIPCITQDFLEQFETHTPEENNTPPTTFENIAY